MKKGPCNVTIIGIGRADSGDVSKKLHLMGVGYGAERHARRNKMTTAEALNEMMEGWNKIMAAARKQFPNATEEELYQIAKGAMNHALGL